MIRIIGQYVGLAGLRRNVPWVYGDDASLLPVSGMLKKNERAMECDVWLAAGILAIRSHGNLLLNSTNCLMHLAHCSLEHHLFEHFEAMEKTAESLNVEQSPRTNYMILHHIQHQVLVVQ